MMRLSSRFLVLLFFPVFFLGAYQLAPAFGNDVTPTDVFGRAAQVSNHLEVLRGHLRLTENQQPELPVTKVSPREVFYQAVAMQKKIYQLANEQGVGAENERRIVIPEGNLTASHVFSVVEDAGKRLEDVLEKLNLSKGSVGEQINSKTPTDVFRSIIQTNRQLNIMLQTKVVPSDVYQRVQESIHLIQVFQNKFAHVGLPPKEVLQPGKTPKDVYLRLIRCFKLQREVLHLADIKVMDLSEDVAVDDKTTPGDVYDMASLVFSEVKVAYMTLKNRPLTPGVFYPGKKSPADVYQLVGVLEEMLTRLLPEVEK